MAHGARPRQIPQKAGSLWDLLGISGRRLRGGPGRRRRAGLTVKRIQLRLQPSAGTIDLVNSAVLRAQELDLLATARLFARELPAKDSTGCSQPEDDGDADKRRHSGHYGFPNQGSRAILVVPPADRFRAIAAHALRASLGHLNHRSFEPFVCDRKSTVFAKASAVLVEINARELGVKE
jgi:hypothetical protein